MIQVVLMWSPAPREVREHLLQVAEGTTLEQLLALAGNTAPDMVGAASTGGKWVTGIWGRKADCHTMLRDGDRVEVYRALRVDPKVARRERFVGQGSRSAGLFAQRRPHSKAGY